MAALWLAGGASRADVAGQVVSRAAATAVLVTALLFAERPSFTGHRAVLVVLILALALPLLQLVPLPPAIWQALPGRDVIARAAQLAGENQPWRPLSMVPSATGNAATSLIVPAAALYCLSGLRAAERPWLPGAVLVLITASMFVGLIQFSGSRFTQPLINYTNDVSGTFANRNHFAVFLALGCLVLPVWAFAGRRRPAWRVPVAGGLFLLLVLTILASGSRAGMVGAGLGLVLGPLTVREDLQRALRGRPRWVLPAIVATIVGLIVVFVLLSTTLGRAVSVERLMAEDVGRDMRSRGLPTVLAMVAHYLPFGTGLGSFDPMFRLNEPFALLKLTYFNQAHNDYLGITLDAGLPGVLVVAAALIWWLRASWKVWRSTGVGSAAPLGPSVAIGRLGSAMLLLLFLASAVDYPMRTPLMMAVAVIAGCWLAWGAAIVRGTSLPMVPRPI
jgi:O-antigen ligase